MPKMLIRPAQAKDANNLAALALQVWLHTYAKEGIRDAISVYVLTEFTPEKFRQLIAAPDKLLLVAESDRHLIAYAVLAFDTPQAAAPQAATELATLYVQAHFAGRGVGSRLLQDCAEAARQRCGNGALWLTTNNQNARAIAFYRKQGYSKCGTAYFVLDGERHENDVMARPTN
ncbi:MAG: GNAT family N-acetyltransferase [Burkholderiales bacterium]|nr:GNAT family N-acetyltransferase [Burkholderiales bacterium]